MKLQELAEKLGCRLEGDPGIEIRGVAGIDHAAKGQVTFLANRRYAPQLKRTQASAVLVEQGVALEREAGLPPLAALRTAIPAAVRAVRVRASRPAITACRLRTVRRRAWLLARRKSRSVWLSGGWRAGSAPIRAAVSVAAPRATGA